METGLVRRNCIQVNWICIVIGPYLAIGENNSSSNSNNNCKFGVETRTYNVHLAPLSDCRVVTAYDRGVAQGKAPAEGYTFRQNG